MSGFEKEIKYDKEVTTEHIPLMDFNYISFAGLLEAGVMT